MLIEKKIWLTGSRYVGLCNRLESLPLAFALRLAYGHRLVLDWPELDALYIPDSERGFPGFFGRIGAARPRKCTLQEFHGLKNRRNIILRLSYGPEEIVKSIYLQTAASIVVRSDLAAEIERIFSSARNYPVVGVHIRRGDFQPQDNGVYDARTQHHPQVPLWWYEYAMAEVLKLDVNTTFFVSSNGATAELQHLARNFNIIRSMVPDPYCLKPSGHNAECHPVVELFALASCKLIIATPISSFSHYAANALGPPSLCLLPPNGVSPATKEISLVQLHGRQLPAWLTLMRQDGRPQLLRDNGMLRPHLCPAKTDWFSRKSGDDGYFTQPKRRLSLRISKFFRTNP